MAADLAARPRRRVHRLVALAVAVILPAAIATPAADAITTATLTRYPYLTDVVGSNATVNWATSGSAISGYATYGTVASGNCDAARVTATKTHITVNGVGEYQWKAQLPVAPDTAYCYRVFNGATPTIDVLGGDPSPQFRSQLPAGSAQPFTFDVFGDWGKTTATGNHDQANLMAQIAASGARFALAVGDTGYPAGSQKSYGDLLQTGDDISAVFGPLFWKVPGASIPLFNADGNHAPTSTYLINWPQDHAVASSGGTYAMQNYCCLNGTKSADYASAWYAFDAGNARFYVLDAAWQGSNSGTVTPYEDDYDYHWTASSPEYQWLQGDLAAHPSQLKFAVFHYPLYSDQSTEKSDTFLQGPGSLEGLLARNGVAMAFNGHAHVYQRTRPNGSGSLISYITGGGGAQLQSMGGHGCSAVNAYGLGWKDPTGPGSSCGDASIPATRDRVFHFLRVTVNGSTVTVAPTDELGRTFDVQTYEFSGP